jgi:hypothetical protein
MDLAELRRLTEGYVRSIRPGDGMLSKRQLRLLFADLVAWIEEQQEEA